MFECLRIPRSIYDAMIAHALRQRPAECVGLLAGSTDGTVRARYELVNASASPTRYSADARSLLQAERQRRQDGLEFLAIYHSHPTSEPWPSQTDLAENYWGTSVMHLIVSLRLTPPRVAAWWLEERHYRPGRFEIVPG
ncbi:MAG: hypothetical protein C4297_12020 [Gemmataceae bacterium]